MNLLPNKSQLISFLVAAGSPLLAQTPQLEVSVEPGRIALGQTAALSVTTTGEVSTRPEVPAMDGIEVSASGRSVYSRIVNGVRSDWTTCTYEIVPRRVGSFDIGPIRWRGMAASHSLEVVAASATRSPGSPTGPSRTGGAPDAEPVAGPIPFLRMKPQSDEAVVGQRVPVEIQAWCPAGVEGSLDSLPTIKGSAFMLDQVSGEPERRIVERNGQTYDVLVWHSALTAIRPGDHPVQGEIKATFRVPDRIGRSRRGGLLPRAFGGRSPFDSMFDDGFFDSFFTPTRPQLVTMTDDEPAVLHVRALADAPAGFDGAVGSFMMTATSSASDVVEGDPVVVTIAVRGRGAFDRVRAPRAGSAKGLIVHDPTSVFEPLAEGRTDAGTKKFEYAVIVNSTDIHEIPPFSLTYYDPQRERFEKIVTPAIPVRVAAAPEGAHRDAIPESGSSAPAEPAPVDDETLTPMADFGVVASASPLRERPWFGALWGLVGVGLVVIAGQAFWRRRDRDPNRRDLRTAARRARGACREHDRKGLADAVRDSIEAARRLSGQATLGAELLARADAVSFGGRTAADQDLEEIWSELQALLPSASRVASSKFAACAVAVAFLTVSAAGQAPAALPTRDAFAAGVDALRRGEHEQAIAAFDRVQEERGPSVALLYDRALAQIGRGQPGRAVADLELAQALEPRSERISSALSGARRAAGLPAGDDRAWFEHATGDEWSWLALLGGAGALLAVWRLTHGGRGPALAGLLMACGIAAGSSIGGNELLQHQRSTAVVVEPVAMRVSPIPDADTVAELPVGSVVGIGEAFDEFRLAVDRVGRRGWLPVSAIRSLWPGAERAGMQLEFERDEPGAVTVAMTGFARQLQEDKP